jgi:hypothetical protein
VLVVEPVEDRETRVNRCPAGEFGLDLGLVARGDRGHQLLLPDQPLIGLGA